MKFNSESRYQKLLLLNINSQHQHSFTSPTVEAIFVNPVCNSSHWIDNVSYPDTQSLSPLPPVGEGACKAGEGVWKWLLFSNGRIKASSNTLIRPAATFSHAWEKGTWKVFNEFFISRTKQPRQGKMQQRTKRKA